MLSATRSLASNKHSSPCAGSETALRSAASRRNIAPKISVPLESPQGSVEFARPPQHSSHLSLAAASACRRKAYREEAVANGQQRRPEKAPSIIAVSDKHFAAGEAH